MLATLSGVASSHIGVFRPHADAQATERIGLQVPVAGGRANRGVTRRPWRASRSRVMAETPLQTLERWEDAGAHWRVTRVAEGEAVVELLSCLGEPVDRLVSDDPQLLDYLARRPASDGA
jgi:hypothetical protein